MASNTTQNTVDTVVNLECETDFKLHSGTTAVVLACNKDGEWYMHDVYQGTSPEWRSNFDMKYITTGCVGKFIKKNIHLCTTVAQEGQNVIRKIK